MKMKRKMTSLSQSRLLLHSFYTASDSVALRPALASPTTLVHTSPWPFGTVTDGGVINRSRTDSVITTRGVPTSINIPIIGSGNVSMPATPEAAEISSQRNSMTALSFAAAYQQQQILPSSLPHEILLHILRLVHSVSDLKSAILVCKSWCQCGVELLWHKPNFKHSAPLFGFLVVISRGAYAAAPPDANLPYMPLTTHRTFPYATFVKRLNFSMIGSDMTDVILGQLAPCVRLERLTVQGNKVITDLGVVNLLSSCRNLVALDFSECSQLTDGALWAVGANCPRLQGINLSGCVKMTDSGITAIAVGCPSLRRVSDLLPRTFVCSGGSIGLTDQITERVANNRRLSCGAGKIMSTATRTGPYQLRQT